MRSFFVYLIFLIVMVAKPVYAEVTKPGYDIIIIAGQSNAVGYGCGPFQDVSKAEDWRIEQVLPEGNIGLAEEPLTFYMRKFGLGGKGLAMTFARLYAEKLAPSRRVLLVPVALGATSIIQWDNVVEDVDFSKHAPLRYDSTELYDNLMVATKRALNYGSAKDNNRIAALLWHQGESDFAFMHHTSGKMREKMPDIAEYSRRVIALMKLYRTQLGQGEFPVVLGEIGEYLPIPGAPLVSEFNRALYPAAEKIGKAAVASASGLMPGSAIGCSFNNSPQFPNGDPYHFHSASIVEFGKRYYKVFSELVKP